MHRKHPDHIKFKRRKKDPGWGWESTKQENVIGWHPVYDLRTVSAVFITWGLTLLIFGGMVYYASRLTTEVVVDYTHACKNALGEECAKVLERNKSEGCQCEIDFRIPWNLYGELVMLYELTNFHQNHRKYGISRDERQLKGLIGKGQQPVKPSARCSPYDIDANGKYYYPCGAVANSFFSDKFQLYYKNETDKTPIKMIREGNVPRKKGHEMFIFMNPPQFKNRSDPIWNFFTRPKDWLFDHFDLGSDNEGKGVESEAFLTWMRIAALPRFKKQLCSLKPLTLQDKSEGLPKGNYSFEIQYNFRVTPFGGTKSLIISELSSLGLKNNLIGSSILGVGAFMILIGSVVLTCLNLMTI